MVKIHFGTDGIRGRANENLTVRMAYRIGQYLGNHFGKEHKARILIGRDTRLSGTMFETALASGITGIGGDAFLLKVCSTPSLVYLVREGKFDCGIMISASHNPFRDNGIKVVTGAGTKMNADVEADIEEYMYGDEELPLATGDRIGEVFDYQDGLEIYYSYLCGLFPEDLSQFRILLDCANGSATVTAEKVFRRLGADVTVMANTPDGMNINRGCGSTHPEDLVEAVKNDIYDAGFAYDGDADRLISVAPDGQIIDGDKVLYMCGKYLKKHGKLRNGKLVTTVMANLGLFKKLDAEGIGYEKTAVGDKYVYDCMCKNDYVLGGEQSGHIIFKDLATTGDGLLTSLFLLKVMREEGKTLNELTDDLFIYPQLLINVEVKDKHAAIEDPEVKAICAKVEEELEGEGRVLVRPSGTEPLIRVMVEARSDELCAYHVGRVVDVIKARDL